MRLRTALTIAAMVGCLSPAVAMVASLTFAPVDLQTSQTPPQIFVRDAGGSVRAMHADDDPSLPAFDASGNALSFTLEKWRAATGTVDVGPDTEGSGDLVTLTLHKLIAFGHYSVFVRTDAADGAHFAPLDGSGITNNFDARQDGSATVVISSGQHLTSGTWLVTIYHSDAQDHGNSPGDFTHTAHQQLTVKLP